MFFLFSLYHAKLPSDRSAHICRHHAPTRRRRTFVCVFVERVLLLLLLLSAVSPAALSVRLSVCLCAAQQITASRRSSARLPPLPARSPFACVVFRSHAGTTVNPGVAAKCAQPRRLLPSQVALSLLLKMKWILFGALTRTEEPRVSGMLYARFLPTAPAQRVRGVMRRSGGTGLSLSLSSEMNFSAKQQHRLESTRVLGARAHTNTHTATANSAQSCACFDCACLLVCVGGGGGGGVFLRETTRPPFSR